MSKDFMMDALASASPANSPPAIIWAAIFPMAVASVGPA